MAIVLWYVWLVFAAANLIDLAVRGRDHSSAVIAAVLVLITGVAYVAMRRPRIIADADSVLLRNPLRDIRVPWGVVTGVDVGDMICVRCEVEATAAGAPPRERVLRGWALQSSHRSRMRAEVRARKRASGWAGASPGFAKLPEEARILAAQPAAVRAAVELDRLGAEARERGARGGEPTITWSWASAAALAVPTLLLALAILVS
ncbi:MAG: PH domain-containing protein [Micromonosporaceae bacterium]